MSLKAELETWAAALKAYDEEDFDKSLELFNRIADSSKILTNMGLIYATLGEHEAAVENFNAATSLDQYLAVAYFQCGVSNFLLTRYDLAFKDFEEALLYLRGNQAINYEQLGLNFKLYSAEVLFNQGLSRVYMGQADEGLKDMEEARQEKATEEHNVIDDAIQDRGEGYTVFSIPVGVLYRPSENKLKNASAKDYLGKAKLVAAVDDRDAYTTFTGVTRLQQGLTPTGAPLDRPAPEPAPERPLNRSATAAPRLEGGGAAPKPVGLTRNATTINVVSWSQRNEGAVPPPDEKLSRSNTTVDRSAGISRGLSLRTPGAGAGLGVARSMSARSPGPGPSPISPSPLAPKADPRAAGRRDDQNAQAPEPPRKGSNQSRLTEIYDDYLDAYAEEVPEVPPLPEQIGDGKNRVAAWARNNANPSSRRGPGVVSTYGSPYAPSSAGGGGSVRRKMSRRPPYGARSVGGGSRSTVYEEEEEGYVSGDYEDGPFELVKIRVKLHYKDDVRGMAVTPEMPFEEFLDRVTQKFKRPIDGLQMKFKDEDDIKVSLRDESDFELAIETARENARGKPEGRLEIWCNDQ